MSILNVRKRNMYYIVSSLNLNMYSMVSSLTHTGGFTLVYVYNFVCVIKRVILPTKKEEREVTWGRVRRELCCYCYY